MRALILSLSLLFTAPAWAQTPPEPPAGMAEATFAGGCFWCVEEAFDAVEGVQSTLSGYTGGETVDPTYQEVTSGRTGHAEAVRVVYDPDVVSYRRLLDVFWHNIDPTQENRQFCDVGSQYRSAIFYHDAEQQRLARETRAAIEESGVLPGPIHTQIVPAATFYVAEDYHQNYYQENPIRYKWYTTGCGRYDRLETLWGDKARTG